MITRYQAFSVARVITDNQKVSKYHIAIVIAVLKDATRSIESQITVIHWLRANGSGPLSSGLRQKEIEEELEDSLSHSVATSLSHLEGIDLVDSQRQRDVAYAIADWHPDTVVNGQVDDVASAGIEALIDELEPLNPQSGETEVATDGSGISLREVVADAFDLHPQAVESHLRKGDSVDRLNDAVEAIEDSDDHEVGDDYGEIKFRHEAYRYRLSETAQTLYEL